MSRCTMGADPCPVHGFIHGKEAEELRAGIERIMARADDDARDLRLAMGELLDEVDARDSLAFLEARDRKAAPAVVEPPLHETIDGRRFIRGHLCDCDVSAHGFDGMKTPEPPCNLGCAELRKAAPSAGGVK